MSVFHFKQFTIRHQHAAMKVGTDSVLLGSLLSTEHKVNTVLDIGSGSGLLAMMMAQRFQEATIDAVEIDALAAQESALNMAECIWSNRLQVHAISFQQFCENTTKHYDLIVSNPPYYIEETNTPIENVQRKMARHQSDLSFEELLIGITKLLAPQGICWVILPRQEAELFVTEISNAGFFLSHRFHLFPKQSKPYNRVVIGFGRSRQKEVMVNECCIYNDDGTHTEAYYQLTLPFLLWQNRG
jgi:tRNA1Val (adenine37-N6)-methyltransferase